MGALTIAATLLLAQVGAYKLASPGLKGANIAPDLATFYSDHLAQQLEQRGLRVITATEIANLLGVERQKQLAGCGEDASSCMAELADALGASATVIGSVGKFEDATQLNIQVMEAGGTRTLSVYSATVTGNEKVLEALDTAADKIAADVLGRVSPPTTVRRFAWAPAAIGVAALGVGVAFAVEAANADASLRAAPGVPGAPASYEAASSAATAGSRNQTIAISLLAVGGAAAVAATVMFFFPQAPRVGAVFTQQGATIGFAGEWP